MKKVLIAISILVLLVGGYGETKTVYADSNEWKPGDDEIDSNYTMYANKYIYNETIGTGTSTTQAVARLKLEYAGMLKGRMINKTGNTLDGFTDYKIAIWKVYIETYTIGVDTSQVVVIENNAIEQISWNGQARYTYKRGDITTRTSIVDFRPALLSEYDTFKGFRWVTSDVDARRLRTPGSITLQIDNTYRKNYIGEVRTIQQLVNYDAQEKLKDWYDVNYGNPQYSPVFWNMSMDATPSGTQSPAFLKKYSGTSGGGGGGDSGGPSQEQQDQLDDQNQSIKDAQDQIKDYEELEQELVNDNAQTLDDLDFTNNTQVLTRPNFISTANWVKTRYEELITGTPLEAVLLLSLSVGLALYVLGRMNR